METQVLDFLRRHHPFDRLTPAELETAARSAGTLAVPGGTIILRQGGRISEFLHIVGRGSAHLVRDGQVLQEIEEGECFGYPSILGGNPPGSDVIAAGEVILHRIPAAVFRELLGNAEFAGFFLTSLSQRLRGVPRGGAAALGGGMTVPVGSLAKAPLSVAPTATVADAARAMRDGRTDVVLVDGDPAGILTDHDFQVKVLAEGRGPDTPVAQVMSSPVKTLPADTPVHGALLYLLEHRIHHLPVTDGERITGIVSAADLLRHQTRSPLSLLHRLEYLEARRSPRLVRRRGRGHGRGPVRRRVEGGADRQGLRPGQRHAGAPAGRSGPGRAGPGALLLRLAGVRLGGPHGAGPVRPTRTTPWSTPRTRTRPSPTSPAWPATWWTISSPPVSRPARAATWPPTGAGPCRR